MTLGGANVWSNFSYGYRIDTPSGWLLNPEGSRIIFFELSRKSTQNNIKIFLHTHYTNHLREPMAIKSSCQMSLDEAWEKWHLLQMQGWTYENITYMN